MELTFGKYKGWDTGRLARFSDGRDYLAWGAAKLDSPKWRKEFQEALDRTPPEEIDLDLEANAIMADDPQIDPADAYILSRDKRAEMVNDRKREEAEAQAREELKKTLLETGADERATTALMRLATCADDIVELESAGRIQFTGDRRAGVIAAFEAYDRRTDEIFKEYSF